MAVLLLVILITTIWKTNSIITIPIAGIITRTITRSCYIATIELLVFISACIPRKAKDGPASRLSVVSTTTAAGPRLPSGASTPGAQANGSIFKHPHKECEYVCICV